MIVFDLKCLDGGEVFEGWFSSEPVMSAFDACTPGKVKIGNV